MPLLKGGALVPDTWVHVGDDERLPESGGAIVTLARWQAERDTLRGRNAPVGVSLPNDCDPAEIAGELDVIELVALPFPAYTDGRAYSSARLLRQRYGYDGEIRATGNVLVDQYPLMLRCGFDAFEVREGTDPALWERAAARIGVEYQHAADGAQAVWAKRHGLASSA